MRGQARLCLLVFAVVGAASSMLWYAGADSPWLGSLFGLGAGCLGAFLVLGFAGRHQV